MDFSELSRINSGFTLSRILQIGVKLGIFNAIKSEGTTSDELAITLGTNLRATELFLNALVAVGVLLKKDGNYFNSDTSHTYLKNTSPKYFGGMILFEHHLWDTWGGLEETIRSGKPRRTPDLFQGTEEETERFILAMHSLVRARGDAEIISEFVDFNWADSLIDIGSGPGTYPIEFLKSFPNLKITIFDLPGTLRITKRLLRAEGMLGKIDLFEGNYNADDIPKGFDIAFLSNIIHNEDEETNQRLMKRIYESLKSGGELIIKDHIMDDSLTNPPFGAIFSIYMLLAANGRDYSFCEIKDWLEDVGFEKIDWKKLPDQLNSSLILAKKKNLD